MLFCPHFTLSAAMETEDLKENHSPADPFTSHLHCTSMKLRQGIFHHFWYSVFQLTLECRGESTLISYR